MKSGRAPYGAVPVHEQLDQEDHVEDGGDGYPELRVLLELRRRGVESGVGWVDWAGGAGWRVFEGETLGRFGGSGARSEGRRPVQCWARGAGIGVDKRGRVHAGRGHQGAADRGRSGGDRLGRTLSG